MHKIITVLLVCFACSKAIAQNNFEGKATYRMSFSSEKDQPDIEVLFGDQKIKVLVKNSGAKPGDKEDLILDFKKGIYYKITNYTKTYTIDSLKKSNNDIFESAKLLVPLPEKNYSALGYKSSAYTLPAVEQNGMDAEKMKVTLWYADSLFYKVPEEYASVEMVPLFTNGSSIGVGMKMLMQLEENKMDSSELKILTVEHKKIPDSLLELPVGYTLAINENAFNDSALLVSPDTTAIADNGYAKPTEKSAQQKAKKSVKSLPKPVKKTTPGQSKSPARKPDN